MTSSDLYPHQREAISKMHNGCILVGGVGSGKSRTALGYYEERVCGKGGADPPLYIVTTARKRDTKDWEKECEPFGITPTVIDSWNNIAKYIDVTEVFFIFDEQRVVGKGKWAKSFVHIAKRNRWILLSATPGDTWMDYVPVLVANGYYRNRTDFLRQHVVYSRNARYPQVERYLEIGKLIRERREIIVNMPFEKKTVAHDETVWCDYDKEMAKLAVKTRWDPYKDEPIADAGGLCYVLRRIVNEEPKRMDILKELLDEHPKAIVFYNFNYELNRLIFMAQQAGIACAQWNGHRHEPIPEEKDRWIYLVQYSAGAEGWNCVETDTIIFFSQNYSYKCMTQAAGRIDRLNTPFTDLYYYHLVSKAPIDMAIRKAIQEKRNFNESMFAGRIG